MNRFLDNFGPGRHQNGRAEMNGIHAKIESLSSAYVMAHPVRATIINYLRANPGAYIAQIARVFGVNERVIAFHISMLSTAGCLTSEYGFTENPKRIVRRYQIDEKKIGQALAPLVSVLLS